MAAPYLGTWSPAAKIAAHEALLALLDAHATESASITIHDVDDVLLATIPLDKPSGAVNQSTGKFTLADAGREEDATAGAASYATLRDGAGDPHISLPCQAGTTPVAGKCVLNTLTIVAGAPVELVSFEVE